MVAMHWQTTRYLLDLQRPHVMGIVNVTPDSFSDGGQYATPNAALRHCEQLLKDGADILDIGGESSRPGAEPLPLAEELERVVPVLRHAVTLGVPVSIDTYKPQLMQVALDMGVDIVNDIWALRQTNAMQVVSRHPNCGVCLMHMHRDPQSMQLEPMQGDAVAQVLSFLEQSAQSLRALGVDLSRICIDPGIGFGKTVAQNFALLAHQEKLVALGYPVLAGWSRKSSLAAVTQTSLSQVASMDIQDRMVPSVAAALMAIERGAHVVRVHDVKETVQALKVLAAVQQNNSKEEA
jgi:dihydropteroate synthase